MWRWRERDRGAEEMRKKESRDGRRERERERDANQLRGEPVWTWVFPAREMCGQRPCRHLSSAVRVREKILL